MESTDHKTVETAHNRLIPWQQTQGPRLPDAEDAPRRISPAMILIWQSKLCPILTSHLRNVHMNFAEACKISSTEMSFPAYSLADAVRATF